MLNFLKEIFLPKFCYQCYRPGAYLCLNCFNKLSLVKTDFCPYCKKPSPFGITHFYCQKKWGIDGLKSIFFYNDLFKKMIKDIKYRFAKEVLVEILNFLPQSKIEEFFIWRKLISSALIIAVPLHPLREKWRGFNQAEIIASYFSALLGFPFEKELVIRIKKTKPQAETKDQKERVQNIAGAFSLKKRFKNLKNKKIIIVDDIWTTGATIREITKLLKKNNAEKVYAITLACTI